ncbi:hypothetical protein ACPEIF_00085 [Streptomyces sp. NPDC012600]|uniref:hypothetical protein n=1 Tax=Streptomyces sp. NPDC012600 TaxID=3415005 RepID=UPI003C2FABDC
MAGAAPEEAGEPEGAAAVPGFALRCTVGGVAAPVPEAAAVPEPDVEAVPRPRTVFGAVPPDRCTEALRPGARPPARPVVAAGRSPAASVTPGASVSPSAPVRAARSSSGPPGEAERAAPGRATPWMRPTGADGSTAWPSSPPNVGFCQEAS